jgi:hypothetical protein
MTQDTSIESFRALRESGELSRKQYEVLLWLERHGPAIGSEVPNNGYKRLSELESTGLIEKIGSIHDDVTNRRAYVWDITHKRQVPVDKPIIVERRPTRKQLENEISRLKWIMTMHGITDDAV